MKFEIHLKSGKSVIGHFETDIIAMLKQLGNPHGLFVDEPYVYIFVEHIEYIEKIEEMVK